ncbi:unnamed protein product [Rotaria sp. Silwood2]|nr:unnamed protein product [Rotaria sp. Silwood2]CAF2927399.1 unnamed protein product [Rotaria sp. Silwood2]CAF3185505.1 unnamed protein product [Rotaria sp. Silwood2]CAF3311756.1 unnamed protein product [Rotaria sp. Silwood2]CAF3940164.1 unnamed protein product [Rotaria sp. Silwood2]
MPNLCQLTVETWRFSDLNGHRWEQIITDYLPKLKTFHLKMQIALNHDEGIQEKVNELIDSFQTSFWLIEHQWFIRCHWIPRNRCSMINIYTLPYSFPYFATFAKVISNSTCPRESDYWSYNHVHTVSHCNAPIIGSSTLSQMHFPNVKHLSVTLRSNDQFWSTISTFDQLISLDISLTNNDNNVRSQLQTILDRASCLYSLKIKSWFDFEVPLVNHTSSSVRRLDLQGCFRYQTEQWFNSEECAKLCHSPLGIQCEVLLIRVEHRTIIIDILNLLTHLRALNIKCRDDNYNKSDEQLLSTEELLQWLIDRLPSTWKIGRVPHSLDCIQMWIN